MPAPKDDLEEEDIPITVIVVNPGLRIGDTSNAVVEEFDERLLKEPLDGLIEEGWEDSLEF
jgi:hypothetical protein